VLFDFTHCANKFDIVLTACLPAWLNNCVGHRNHRHFFLFCVYMCVGCFYVSLSGYPLFKEHFYGIQVFYLVYYIISAFYCNVFTCHD